MHILSVSLFVVAAAFSLSSCSKQNSDALVREGWDANNHPSRLSNQFVVHYASLPLAGKVERAFHPWSETFWPSFDAGISRRWQTPRVNHFQYALKSEQEVAAMSFDELKLLSPTEKYDIFMGRFDYPLTTAERSRTSPDARLWDGLCHGWAPAALHFQEPDKVVVRGATGINIPFASSDVKALIIYNQAIVSDEPVAVLGNRCNAVLSADPAAGRNPECRDVNAGSFHIVIGNMLGIQKKGFVGELERDWMVWNHPVFGFESREVARHGPSAGAAPTTSQEVEIETTLHYVTEGSAHYNPVIGTPSQLDKKIVYRYRLELDSGGNIVGGEWLTDARPDFLWTQPPAPFQGYLEGISKIYRPVK